ncbi:MAG: TraR/DksA family transcriptional regulator [Gammaproteobacteria bacterium]
MTTQVTTEQIERLKASLLERKDALVSRQHAEQERDPPVGEVHDQKDDAFRQSVTEKNAELTIRLETELQEIEGALQRIHDQTYGVCIDCGKEIAFQRLLAYPQARRCIDCKRRYEAVSTSPAAFGSD